MSRALELRSTPPERLLMRNLAVLNPTVSDVVAPVPAAPALAGIVGARIAFVDNSKQNADLFLGRLKPLFERHGARPGDTIRKLAPKDALTSEELERLASCDAVVQCFGD